MPVTPDMIAVALGQAAPETGSVQELQWEMWIGDAEMLIEARRARVAATTVLDEAKVDYVVREAVVAHIKKPDDATQVTIAVDDGSTARTYQSGKGRVTILDEWWFLLGLAENSNGAYAFDMAPPMLGHLFWCSLTLGATYCSCGVDIAQRPIYEGGEL